MIKHFEKLTWFFEYVSNKILGLFDCCFLNVGFSYRDGRMLTDKNFGRISININAITTNWLNYSVCEKNSL